MDTISVLGDEIQVSGNPGERHVTVFTPDEILPDWKRCGRLADSLSGMYNSPTEERSRYMFVSTIINEIIENSVKYTSDTQSPVEIITFMLGTSLYVKATNEVSERQLEQFMTLCRELYSSDLDTLLKRRLRGMNSHRSSPGIGLILLKKNFNTDLNFTFSRDENTFQVTTLVNINLEQDSQWKK